jgi:hypothetical protein
VALGDNYRGWTPPIWNDQHAGRRSDSLPPVGLSFQQGIDFITRQSQASSEQRRIIERQTAIESSASDLLRDLLRNEISPALRTLGMKGSAGRYRLERGPSSGLLEIQKRSGGSRRLCEFTFNLSAEESSDPKRVGGFTYWTARIGEVLPERGDTWWVLPSHADIESLRQDLVRALRDHAFVALDAALAVLPRPLDPARRWPARPTDRLSSFVGPEAVARALQGEAPANWRDNPGYEALLAEADTLEFSSTEDHARSQVLEMLLHAAPSGDPRCFPVLAGYLNQEPNAASRATAAFALALLKMSPAPRLEELKGAATYDSDLSVRLFAGYATKLIEAETTSLANPGESERLNWNTESPPRRSSTEIGGGE